MKILVIPDVHLKPFMFDQAAQLLKKGEADRAVCLMDIADDWGKQYEIYLYVQTYDAAIRFAKEFPDTLWCYGNHDLSYPWQCKESGYSPIAPRQSNITMSTPFWRPLTALSAGACGRTCHRSG